METRRTWFMPEMFPEEIQRFVEHELARGHFRSTRDLLLEGIRLLQRERLEAAEGIQLGLADAEAGRIQPLDEAFADLRRELGLPAEP
jgi:predicted transcriptional regulator